MSHSDIFTYHMVIIELISVFGSSISCCGIHANLPEMLELGVYLLSVNMSGQMLFHILTCAERYLAVVHPITYLGLRKTKGIRIRNIIIGCVWILCFAATSSMTLRDEVSMLILSFSVLGFMLSVISFCSISVLCTLIRPGPADRVEGRQRIDQSKLRAFYTIMAILGVLLIRFGGNCFEVTVGSHIFAALSCTYIFFFLPLCIYILHLGLRRRRRRRSVSGVTTSSSDIFTYNIVAMEMIGVLGCCFYCSGVYAYTLQIKLVGLYIFNIVTPGQMFFHILTCMERYLAVIHPIVYLGLKKANGVRLRNTSVGFAWVLSLG
ncbi:uncharacterized protein AKAME5_002481700, partial [Lates japonicus]